MKAFYLVEARKKNFNFQSQPTQKAMADCSRKVYLLIDCTLTRYTYNKLKVRRVL